MLDNIIDIILTIQAPPSGLKLELFVPQTWYFIIITNNIPNKSKGRVARSMPTPSDQQSIVIGGEGSGWYLPGYCHNVGGVKAGL
jgi:hypothetical protein